MAEMEVVVEAEEYGERVQFQCTVPTGRLQNVCRGRCRCHWWDGIGDEAIGELRLVKHFWDTILEGC